MRVTQKLMMSFINRAERVIRRYVEDEAIECVTIIDHGDEVRYLLPPMYMFACQIIAPTHFVMLRPNIEELERVCDPEHLKALGRPAQWMEPLLCLPDGTLIDGNHRALKRMRVGHKLIPAFMYPEDSWERINEIVRTHTLVPTEKAETLSQS